LTRLIGVKASGVASLQAAQRRKATPSMSGNREALEAEALKLFTKIGLEETTAK
jgi:hypothetical protein